MPIANSISPANFRGTPSTSISTPVPDADTPKNSTSAKRRKASRACDQCRKKKIKCDFDDRSGLCTNCKKNGEVCSFERVQLKRGPSKGYHRQRSQNSKLSKSDNHGLNANGDEMEKKVDPKNIARDHLSEIGPRQNHHKSLKDANVARVNTNSMHAVLQRNNSVSGPSTPTKMGSVHLPPLSQYISQNSNDTQGSISNTDSQNVQSSLPYNNSAGMNISNTYTFQQRKPGSISGLSSTLDSSAFNNSNNATTAAAAATAAASSTQTGNNNSNGFGSFSQQFWKVPYHDFQNPRRGSIDSIQSDLSIRGMNNIDNLDLASLNGLQSPSISHRNSNNLSNGLNNNLNVNIVSGINPMSNNNLNNINSGSQSLPNKNTGNTGSISGGFWSFFRGSGSSVPNTFDVQTQDNSQIFNQSPNQQQGQSSQQGPSNGFQTLRNGSSGSIPSLWRNQSNQSLFGQSQLLPLPMGSGSVSQGQGVQQSNQGKLGANSSSNPEGLNTLNAIDSQVDNSVRISTRHELNTSQAPNQTDQSDLFGLSKYQQQRNDGITRESKGNINEQPRSSESYRNPNNATYNASPSSFNQFAMKGFHSRQNSIGSEAMSPSAPSVYVTRNEEFNNYSKATEKSQNDSTFSKGTDNRSLVSGQPKDLLSSSHLVDDHSNNASVNENRTTLNYGQISDVELINTYYEFIHVGFPVIPLNKKTLTNDILIVNTQPISDVHAINSYVLLWFRNSLELLVRVGMKRRKKNNTAFEGLNAYNRGHGKSSNPFNLDETVSRSNNMAHNYTDYDKHKDPNGSRNSKTEDMNLQHGSKPNNFPTDKATQTSGTDPAKAHYKEIDTNHCGNPDTYNDTKDGSNNARSEKPDFIRGLALQDGDSVLDDQTNFIAALNECFQKIVDIHPKFREHKDAISPKIKFIYLSTFIVLNYILAFVGYDNSFVLGMSVTIFNELKLYKLITYTEEEYIVEMRNQRQLDYELDYIDTSKIDRDMQEYLLLFKRLYILLIMFDSLQSCTFGVPKLLSIPIANMTEEIFGNSLDGNKWNVDESETRMVSILQALKVGETLGDIALERKSASLRQPGFDGKIFVQDFSLPPANRNSTCMDTMAQGFHGILVRKRKFTNNLLSLIPLQSKAAPMDLSLSGKISEALCELVSETLQLLTLIMRVNPTNSIDYDYRPAFESLSIGSIGDVGEGTTVGEDRQDGNNDFFKKLLGLKQEKNSTQINLIRGVISPFAIAILHELYNINDILRQLPTPLIGAVMTSGSQNSVALTSTSTPYSPQDLVVKLSNAMNDVVQITSLLNMIKPFKMFDHELNRRQTLMNQRRSNSGAQDVPITRKIYEFANLPTKMQNKEAETAEAANTPLQNEDSIHDTLINAGWHLLDDSEFGWY